MKGNKYISKQLVMNIRLKAEEAVQLFEQHIEEEQPIIDNGTGEEFIPKDDKNLFSVTIRCIL